MDVLVTGAVNEVGRAVAAAFRGAGHHVVITGSSTDDLAIVAKELEVDSVACDNTDPDSLEQNVALFPQHLDAIVNIPNLIWQPAEAALAPRSLTDTGECWLSQYESSVLTAVLTVEAVGDHLRSGAAIINLSSLDVRDRTGATSAARAALSAWTAEQAERLGTRGITINTIAPGQPAEAGYEDTTSGDPRELMAGEVARLSLFLASAQARHITGQTVYVSRGVPAAAD